MKIIKLVLGFFSVNCYIVSEKNTCFIIDPGADPDNIENCLNSEGLKPSFILNTHGHYDHIGAIPEIIKKYSIPFYMHRNEEFIIKDPEKNLSSVFGSGPLALDTCIYIDEENQDFFKNTGLKIYNMPGHTPGSIIIEIQNCLFTGDLLFRDGVGRTDLSGGNQQDMIESLKKLKKFDWRLKIFPGHGAGSTLEYEFENNFYLSSDFLEGGSGWF